MSYNESDGGVEEETRHMTNLIDNVIVTQL